jgi:hypothetical protein
MALDLSLRRASFPVSLEKWYVDALLDDGTVCLVYIGSLAVGGARINRVTAELFRSDGSVVRGAAKVGRIVAGAGFLRCSAADIDGDRLRFHTAGLSGDLNLRPLAAPWTAFDPFVVAGRRALTWSVEIPDASVEGRLRWPDAELPVRGRGYRDRVWFDLYPWRFPIARLRWGRAAAGEHAAVWSRATTTDGRTVAGAWLDGAAVDLPSDGPPGGVALEGGRTFLDADVADLEGLRLGVLRRPFARLGGAPHETKRQARCTINGVPGVAVDEIVTWRTGQDQTIAP